MALKTDENVRGLAELLATFSGKGSHHWKEHTEEAVRFLLAFDYVVETAKESSHRQYITRPVLVRG